MQFLVCFLIFCIKNKRMVTKLTGKMVLNELAKTSYGEKKSIFQALVWFSVDICFSVSSY